MQHASWCSKDHDVVSSEVLADDESEPCLNEGVQAGPLGALLRDTDTGPKIQIQPLSNGAILDPAQFVVWLKAALTMVNESGVLPDDRQD